MMKNVLPWQSLITSLVNLSYDQSDCFTTHLSFTDDEECVTTSTLSDDVITRPVECLKQISIFHNAWRQHKQSTWLYKTAPPIQHGSMEHDVRSVWLGRMTGSFISVRMIWWDVMTGLYHNKGGRNDTMWDLTRVTMAWVWMTKALLPHSSWINWERLRRLVTLQKVQWGKQFLQNGLQTAADMASISFFFWMRTSTN